MWLTRNPAAARRWATCTRVSKRKNSISRPLTPHTGLPPLEHQHIEMLHRLYSSSPHRQLAGVCPVQERCPHHTEAAGRLYRDAFLRDEARGPGAGDVSVRGRAPGLAAPPRAEGAGVPARLPGLGCSAAAAAACRLSRRGMLAVGGSTPAVGSDAADAAAFLTASAAILELFCRVRPCASWLRLCVPCSGRSFIHCGRGTCGAPGREGRHIKPRRWWRCLPRAPTSAQRPAAHLLPDGALHVPLAV